MPADIVGARAAGILAAHFDPYGDCDGPGNHAHIRSLGEAQEILQQALVQCFDGCYVMETFSPYRDERPDP